MQVTIKPHVGQQRREGITVDVQLPQYMIFVQVPEREALNLGPLHYGYVGFHAGEPINPLPVVEAFPPDWHQRVADEVNRLLVEAGKPGARTVSGIFGAWPEEADDDSDDGTDTDESDESDE